MRKILLTICVVLLAAPLWAQLNIFEPGIPPNGAISQTGSSALLTNDNLFQVDGPWCATGSNSVDPTALKFSMADPSGQNQPPIGYWDLNTYNGASNSCSTTYYMSEAISNLLPGTNSYFPQGLGYGYYEAKMIVDYNHVSPGGVTAFFLQAAGGILTSKQYGPGEFDMEFLMNSSWASGCGVTTGTVQLTTHPSGTSVSQSLPFNPSCGYHRYGMLWLPPGVTGPNGVVGANGELDYYADGSLLRTVTSADVKLPTPSAGGGNGNAHTACTGGLVNSSGGTPASCGQWFFINVWTGNGSFGGGPPASPIHSAYEWLRFWPNVTSIPSETSPYAAWSGFPQDTAFVPIINNNLNPTRTLGTGAPFTNDATGTAGTYINSILGIDNGGGDSYPTTFGTDTNGYWADFNTAGDTVFPMVQFPVTQSVGLSGNGTTCTATAGSNYGSTYTVGSKVIVTGGSNASFNMTSTPATIATGGSGTTALTYPCSVNSTGTGYWVYSVDNTNVESVSSLQTIATNLGITAKLNAYQLGDEPQGGSGQAIPGIPTYIAQMQAIDSTRPYLWNHTDWVFGHGLYSPNATLALNTAALKATSFGSFDEYPLTSPYNTGQSVPVTVGQPADFMWIEGWSINQFVAAGNAGQPMLHWPDIGTNELGYSGQNTSVCNPVANICSPSTTSTTASEASSTVTLTTTSGNFGSSFTSSTAIYVSGCSVAGYNGTWTIASGGSGGSTLTYTDTNTGLGAATGCYAQTPVAGYNNEYRATAEQVNAEIWMGFINGALGYEVFCPDSLALDFCIGAAQSATASASGSGTVVTMTSGSNYGNMFERGTPITLTSCGSFNGTYTIAQGGAGTTTLTFASSTTGTASSCTVVSATGTQISQNLRYINTTILSFAPMINAPTSGICTMNTGTSYANYNTSCVNGLLTMSTGNSSVPGSAVVKNYNGTLYLFADSDRNGSATMTFTLTGYPNATATVIYDSNAKYDPSHSTVGNTFTLSSSAQFSDTFGANGHNYQPKIYAITTTQPVVVTVPAPSAAPFSRLWEQELPEGLLERMVGQEVREKGGMRP